MTKKESTNTLTTTHQTREKRSLKKLTLVHKHTYFVTLSTKPEGQRVKKRQKHLFTVLGLYIMPAGLRGGFSCKVIRYRGVNASSH